VKAEAKAADAVASAVAMVADAAATVVVDADVEDAAVAAVLPRKSGHPLPSSDVS
jgi:hypothetical protein